MNLCIDQGNSCTKIGIFNQNNFLKSLVFDEIKESDIKNIIKKYSIEKCIISSVGKENYQVFNTILESNLIQTIFLSHTTPIPISNNYKTPETLGKDRLAAIIGASYLQPKKDLLVIDAGTAITYDFIDKNGNYIGGNIAPGVNLRFKALYDYTAKLPHINPDRNSELLFLGNDTSSAIESGVINGIYLEICGYIENLKLNYPELSTFLTGGSAFYFVTKLKNPIFVESNLVLIGLNRILQYNV